MTISTIQQVLQAQTGLELAVLVGSRADGRAHSESDWDIAIQWKREITMFDNLANTEILRRKLAAALGVGENLIDLIDLPRAGLTMRALVAEEGVELKGEDSLAWNHFLGRVWRELEAYEWEKQHAA
jgi:predicted nucleotidyltransferase